MEADMEADIMMMKKMMIIDNSFIVKNGQLLFLIFGVKGYFVFVITGKRKGMRPNKV